MTAIIIAPDRDRRQRIMAEAAVHFLRDGFERTSIDRIAAGARVSKQTIYEHFRSKEELFDRVVRAELRDMPAEGLVAGGDVQAALDRFALGVAAAFAEPRNHGLFRASMVVTRRFTVLANALHDYRRGTSRALADYLDRLLAEGRLAPFEGTALDLATRIGGMAVEGSRYFLGEPLPAAAVGAAQARLAVAIFLHGFRAAADLDQGDDVAPAALVPALAPGSAQMRLSAERFAGLCAAAVAEFVASGFEGASIDRIIAAAGVGRSTIYRQFGNKDGLFRYVIGREIAAIIADEVAAPAGPDIESRLAMLARIALERHLEPASIGLHHLLVQEAKAFPDLARAFYAAQVARVGRPFAALLVQEGAPSPSPAVVRAFHTLATFGVRYFATVRSVSEDERAMASRQAARIIHRGLGVENPIDTAV
ncbi:TetR/AcrR family transcriptional regulator [Sphingomonas sp. KC8]|uniref:TetR/AcrR family transcriptional regulator n=1 Tax=Sphingomonas sp. KC8 TaxID=1030157 RepID=UPI000680D043|nr:TetR/AcrR family transcriptional regulator [Sphingomonas sp. KC8]ARS27555.1 TetR family transcriptional regulator [Sphingomonas sp. KC8]